MTTNRVPPNNLEAEAALVGAMLLSRTAIDAATQTCATEHFYKPAYGHIYDTVVDLHAAGEPADVLTVAARLKQTGLLDAIGGPTVLTDLIANATTIGNADRYAAIIRDCYLLRRLIGVAGEIAELGYDEAADAPTAFDQAEHLLFSIVRNSDRRAASHLGDRLGEWLDDLAARQQNGQLQGVTTGLHDLDDLLLGLHPGQLVTIAGRPGMGKSQVGVHLTRAAGHAGHRSLLFSIEMNEHELHGRYLASEAIVGLQNLRSANVSDKDRARLDAALPRLTDLPVWIDDNPSANLMTIRATARRVAAQAGGLDLIVLDYTQLVDALGKHDKREAAVAEVARGLKRLAGDLQVPVVALAQLNRGVEQRMDKRPMLSDLRESGEIENASDVVILLYRDEYYRPDSPDKGILELSVAKQRNGPTGTVKAAYQAHTGLIANMARVA